MSNQIINFTFENLQVRIIDQDNNHWFVATDVCNILEIQNTSQALQALDDDEKSTTILCDVSLNGTKQNREVSIINESGLYALILRSRKAMQKGTVQHKFRKWVTSEVLPSIRKTGSYATQRATISIEQQAIIRQAVAKRCKSQSVHYQTIYTALQKHFDVPRYSELLVNDFNEALALIEVVELPQAIDHQPLNIQEFLNRQSNQIMDYVHGLEQAIFTLTGKYPQRPFNRDDIAKGVIGACLNHQTIELNFSESGLGFNLVDRATLRIHDSNIAEHIKLGNVNKKYLDDIIQASVARLA